MTANPDFANRLRAFIARVRFINDQIRDLQVDRREVFAEMKEVGIDNTIAKLVIKRMDLDPDKLIEAEALLESYELIMASGAQAVGQLAFEKGADGTFQFKMTQDAQPKIAGRNDPTKKAQARRQGIALAEAAKHVRGM